MRFFVSTVLLLALAFSIAAQNPPPAVKEYDAKAWKEFSSAEGRFTVSLPGSPMALPDRTMDTGIGPLKTHSFFLQTDMGGYYVAYVDFPVGPTTPEETKEGLDSSRDRALANGGRLISESDFSVGGTIGRELLVEKNDQILRARYIYIKKRLYQLILASTPNVVFKNGKPSANAADRTDLFEKASARFFDSFKLTE